MQQTFPWRGNVEGLPTLSRQSGAISSPVCCCPQLGQGPDGGRDGERFSTQWLTLPHLEQAPDGGLCPSSLEVSRVLPPCRRKLFLSFFCSSFPLNTLNAIFNRFCLFLVTYFRLNFENVQEATEGLFL